jgi:hypothetical protein
MDLLNFILASSKPQLVVKLQTLCKSMAADRISKKTKEGRFGSITHGLSAYGRVRLPAVTAQMSSSGESKAEQPGMSARSGASQYSFHREEVKQHILFEELHSIPNKV